MQRRVVPLALLGALVLVLAGAGCGDEEGDDPAGGGQDSAEPQSPAPPEPPAEEHPPADADAGGFTGQDAENYDIAKTICGSFPPGKVARDLGLHVNGDTAGELAEIAERYADDYRGPYRQAAFEGCLDGLPNPP